MSRATTTAPRREPVAMESILDEIESVVEESGLQQVATEKPFRRALAVASGIRRLREIMSLEMVDGAFMDLQNSALGFRTDKPDGGYPAADVRDCLIEGFLRGALPVGNEINIIARRAYLTKEFFERAVSEIPGVRDVEKHIGVPSMKDGGALVPFVVTWMQSGELKRYERLLSDDGKRDERIPVRVNAGMGADAIIGKATRKALKAVYERITGTKMDIPDGDSDEARLTQFRERATFDPAALKPGAEPNRGHGQDGLGAVGKPAPGELIPGATTPADREPLAK